MKRMRAMKSVRGCTNKECDSYKKNDKYKKDYDYCPKCGSKLMAVCNSRGCHTFLNNPDGIYCARCLAKRKDSADHAKKNISTIGGGLLAAGGLVAKNGRTITSVVAKAIKFLPK